MMLRFPVTSLFSKLVPSGIMILLPSLATKIQVPASRTPLPIQTSPEMVKWSSSRILGMDLNRFSKFYRYSASRPGTALSGTTHCDLLEVVTQLDDGRSTELSRLVHGQDTVL